MKSKAHIVIKVFAILTILGGVIGVIDSLSVNTVLRSVSRGGVLTESSVSVLELQQGSPADEAGIRKGDHILSVNNNEITSSQEFIQATQNALGEEVSITIERDGQTQNISLVPESNPEPGKGSVGIYITDTAIEEMKIHKLIPYTIMRGYKGYEEIPIGVIGTQSKLVHDPSLSNIRTLILSIISIIVGIGMLQLRKWGMYGYFLLALLSVISSANLIKDFSPLLMIFLFIEVFVVVFIYMNRKVFS